MLRALSWLAIASGLVLLMSSAGCGGDDDGGDGGIIDPDDPSCREDNLPCPGCPTGSFCWLHPTPTGEPLSSLAASSDQDVWAKSGERSLLHWNGESWQLWSVTRPEAFVQVSAADGAAWVAASQGLLHFDSIRWTRVDVPAELGAVRLVSAVTATSVWVSDGSLVARYSDGDWTMVTGGPSEVVEMWAASDDELFALGANRTSMHRYAAGSWSDVTPDSATRLFHLTGVSPEHVWVADVESGGSEDLLQLFGWNGAGWDAVPRYLSTSPSALAVMADGRFVVGQGSDIRYFDGTEFVDDSLWHRPYTPYGFGDEVTGLVVTGESTAWGIGLGGHILRNEGDGWVTFNAMPDEGMGLPLAVAPGELWIPGTRFMHHLQDGQWSDGGTYGGALFARTIFRDSDGTLWSAHSNRGIWQLAGDAWTLYSDDPAVDNALTVWSGDGEVWAALEDGSVLQHVEGVWMPLDVGIDHVMIVWGRGAGSRILVGRSTDGTPRARRFDGETFTDIDLGAATSGYASFEDQSGTVYLAQSSPAGSTIAIIDQTSVTQLPLAEGAGPVTSMWASSPENLWVVSAVADEPTALSWDGDSWTAYPIERSGLIASDGTDVYLGRSTGVMKLAR